MVSVAPPHLLEGASAIGVIHAGYSAVNAGPGLSSHRRPNSEQSVPPASACRTSLPLLLRRWLWPPSTSDLDVVHEEVDQEATATRSLNLRPGRERLLELTMIEKRSYLEETRVKKSVAAPATAWKCEAWNRVVRIPRQRESLGLRSRRTLRTEPSDCGARSIRPFGETAGRARTGRRVGESNPSGRSKGSAIGACSSRSAPWPTRHRAALEPAPYRTWAAWRACSRTHLGETRRTALHEELSQARKSSWLRAGRASRRT